MPTILTDLGTEGVIEQMLAGLFGRAAATYDTVIPLFARFGHRLVALADLQPGERVLDVAAGRGALLFPAAEAGGPTGSVVAVDLARRWFAGAFPSTRRPTGTRFSRRSTTAPSRWCSGRRTGQVALPVDRSSSAVTVFQLREVAVTPRRRSSRSLVSFVRPAPSG